MTTTSKNIVSNIEAYLTKYVAFPPESGYSLPIALWAMMTHIWPMLDTLPYLMITSDTKRSGKTTTMDLVSFISANSQNVAAMSMAAMFRSITEEHPTLFIDEAEQSISGENSELRPVVNVGYRRGNMIKRVGKGGVQEFETYCPKAFVMIGDAFDTLRDRCLIIRMRRANNADLTKYRYSVGKADGDILREQISEAVKEHYSEIQGLYDNFKGLDFLSGRDEELWTPLFILAQVFCPNRVSELSRIAVDMATEKTSDRRDYRVLLQTAEKQAEVREFGEKLLRDMASILNDKSNKRVWTSSRGERVIPTSEVLDALKAIETSPWRKFRGEGLTAYTMSDLLDQFGLNPQTVRIGKGKNSKTLKGYKRSDVERAMKDEPEQ